MDNKYYLYKPNTENIIKSIGSEELGWRFYFVLAKVTPTPTNTPSASIGATPTQTPSQTPTISLTRTQTPTPTQTATVTPTRTPNSTPGITPSNSSTPAVTPTSTPTQSNPAPSATPSSTPNASCGYTVLINGPTACSEYTNYACYGGNSLNDITVYTSDSLGGATIGSPIYTNSSCSTLLSTDGAYLVKQINGSGVNYFIIYIKNGYSYLYLGNCSFSTSSAYYCDGQGGCSACDPSALGPRIGQEVYIATDCGETYTLCGAYYQPYCDIVSSADVDTQCDPCGSLNTACLYSSLSACQANC